MQGVSAVFEKLLDSFFAAGKVFTLEGTLCCSAQCRNDVSYVTKMNHESDFFVAGEVFGDVGW